MRDLFLVLVIVFGIPFSIACLTAAFNKLGEQLHAADCRRRRN